nr:hypothetical protein [Tanacetum cinerariifolium]
NSNVDFLLKTKEQIEEDENRALQTINETPTEKATKRRKLNEEVEDLNRHLQIVPNQDDDVYTEANPLARKVPVVDYKIIKMINKPYYKFIRADGTHQLYISFLTLLRTLTERTWRLYEVWDPEEESTTSIIIPTKTKSKYKGKGILVEEPKPLKKKQQIEQAEQYARELHAELNKDIDWDEAIDHVKLKAKEDPSEGEETGENDQSESIEAQKDDAVVLKDDKEEDKDVADVVKDVEKAKVD